MTVDSLLHEYKKYFPANEEQETLIRHAYSFARRAHKGQLRKSGDEFFSHVFETARQLTHWKLDATSIAAGLLHDCAEDCAIPIETISKEFGSDVAFLVEGVTKLNKLQYKEGDADIESLRKMILAISKDLRVIFIKLADRLHNMRTLSFLQPSQQRETSLETVEIYAPIASRLGMQNVSGDLEDLAFPYINPQAYQWITKNISESYEERQRYLKRIESVVREHITKAGVTPIAIDYRAKRLYSLYKKLLRFDMNLEQIYDLVAVRIIVNTIDECYLVLGAIHHTWPPMPGKIKDYIALPKPNGYQSLHTTVFCVDNRPAEFQIRTKEMHDHAEGGSAAHWLYESKKHSEKERSRFSANIKEISWVQQLQEWQEQFPGSKEFLESLKIDFFSDRIFVLTPKGRTLDLPVGATPVDFAYKIHTDIGDSCIGAKVNNKIVTLDYQLQSGDIVEILTQKNKKPSEGWIQFVKTGEAKKKIKARIAKKALHIKKTEYKLVAERRIGMVKDLLALFARAKIGINGVRTINEQSPFPTIKITADIKEKEKAEEMLVRLRKTNGVKEASYKIN